MNSRTVFIHTASISVSKHSSREPFCGRMVVQIYHSGRFVDANLYFTLSLLAAVDSPETS